MPNEILITHSVQLHREGSNAPYTILGVSGVRLEQDGDAISSGIQSITTSAVNLALPNISEHGYGVFENLDDENFVQLGWDSGGFEPALKLMPGGVYAIPLDPSRTWQARADTAPVLLRYSVLEA